VDVKQIRMTSVPSVLIEMNYVKQLPASVVYWPEFLAADPEVPGSIPGSTRLSE
jgi:hypothetical protein